MMDLDAVSNCSSSSLHSEDTKSEISTLSGLSNYQDEFSELRHLVNPLKYPINTFNRCSTPKSYKLNYENNVHISTLSQQLERSQQVQENYKSDLYNLEKSLELKYYDKIEKLLKANHRLQSELESANDQIARLLKNYSKYNVPALTNNSFIQLEQKYHGLTTKYSELQRDYFQNKTAKEEYEIENKHLKIELNELKIDIETKEECVKEFKQKVSQQYVEIETLLKNNLKHSQNVNELTSELAHLKKTQDWYKERLHICQNEKQILSDEILKCKKDSCTQHENIENLNVELSKWKTKCELTELNALKDKEKMCKQLESINLTSNLKNDQLKININETKENEEYIVNYYESSIEDLTHEIVKIKEYVQEQDNIVVKLTKENSELIAQCITLQNRSKHTESIIEELENVKKQLHAEINEIKCKFKTKSDELIVRESQILNLQAEMRMQKNEHDSVEQTVKTIREQFTIFKSKHKELKDELSTKDKHILQLENEKQKLFMNNNWNICELEKLKEKDVVISQLRKELTKNGESLNEYLKIIEMMKNEKNKNQEKSLTLLDEKQSTIDKNHLEIDKYENALTQYKVLVNNYEKQITDLQKLLSESNNKIADLKDNIKILKQEINRKDVNINEISNKCIVLENELKCTQEIKHSKSFRSENMSDEKKLNDRNNSNFSLQYFKNPKDYNCTTVPSGVNQLTLEKNNSRHNNIIYNREKTVTLESNFKKQLVLKIKVIEDRIKKLDATCHRCFITLNDICDVVKGGNQEGQMQKLKVLVQVKELELKEKQKKYETNNRTLLRKVKEHMKGRDAAEKHNKYLQDMYNSVIEKNNSLKLEIMSKEYEVENMKNIIDKFTNVNEKLKLKLEEKVTKRITCDKCDLAFEKIEQMESYIKDLENEKLTSQSILVDKEEIVSNLRKEIQQLLQTNVSIDICNKKLMDEKNTLLQDKDVLTNTVKTLEGELEKNNSLVDELNKLLKKEKKQFSEIVLENSQLKNCVNELNAQIKYLTNEVKILSSRLQVKSEELIQLEDEKSKMKSNWLEKHKDSQIVISTLKQYIHEIQLEIASINNEKYFLQRLCNDLKLALKSHTSHNKVLQQQLNAVSKEKDFNSLPNVLPNISYDIKYDDDYINQLLQQNRAPLQGKSIIEMKSCLDTLKREISTLQDQIAKKNIQY